MATTIALGNTARLDGQFRDENGALFDPPSPRIAVRFLPLSGGTPRDSYLIATRQSLGTFRARQRLLEPGEYRFRLESWDGTPALSPVAYATVAADPMRS